MEEVGSKLVDQRRRTLLNRPEMTPVARRIVITTLYYVAIIFHH